MNIEETIFNLYNQLETTDEPNIDLLFNVITNFIKEKKWVYEGSERDKNVCELPVESELIVNCFHLADLFVQMAKKIGVEPDQCYRVELCNFVNIKQLRQ